MVLFNHATREMTAKIVYYGPGLCGKTTNLMVIFDKLDPKSKGKMLSLATKTDRTLFFDLLPVDIGKVGAFNLKIQLYTVPGQVFYNETRKLVLKGADAVVFVADSQPSMVDSNRESFANLLDNLAENQIDINDTPVVVQFNKRDIPGVLSVEQLQELLGFEGYPYTEASAIKGDGVMETFKLVSKITAKHLLRRAKGRPGTNDFEAKKTTSAAKVKVAGPAVPITDSEPDEADEVVNIPAMNPFADSVPFPDAGPTESAYENAEEVSLEELLADGRERPATMSGDVAVPYVEEVEEIGADELVAVADEPVEELSAVEELSPVEELSVVEEISPVEEWSAPEEAASGEVLAERANDSDVSSARVAELESQVHELVDRLDILKRDHRAELESLLTEIEGLAQRVRARIDA